MNSTIQKKAVVLLGPPGGGKTSVVNEILRRDNAASLQTGNILRTEMKNDTQIGRDIKDLMESGSLVPTEVISSLIKQKVKNIEKEIVLFDGFPRIEEQLEYFFDIIESEGIELFAVLVLEIPDEIIMKRLTGREVCPVDGSIYNIYFNPPKEPGKCDICGSQLEQRDDDKPEIVEDRLTHYKEHTMPVVNYFEGKYPGRTIHIPGEDGLEFITSEILAFFKKLRSQD